MKLTPDPGLDAGSITARPPGMRRTRIVAALSGLLALGLSAAILAAPQAAFAGPNWAGLANGLGGISDDYGLAWAGSYDLAGGLAFCVSPGMNSPVGGMVTGGGTVNPGWSDDTAAQVNFVLSTWGPTGDDNTAAAAQFAVWQLIAPFAWNTHGYSGGDFRAAVVWDLQEIGPLSGVGSFSSSRINTVADAAVSIYDQALGVTAARDRTDIVGVSTTSTSHATIPAAIAQIGDGAHFVVTVGDGIDPGGATGTLTLTNATFDVSGTATLAGSFASGETFPATADQAGRWTIGVTGVATGNIVTTTTTQTQTTDSGWGPWVTIFYNSDPARQSLAWGGGQTPYTITTITNTTNTDTRSYDWAASLDASIVFAPRVSTSAATTLAMPGTTLTDTVTPGLLSGSAAWAKKDSRTWLPVTYRAAIYRLAGPLQEGEQLPADAEFAGTATLTTTIASDPTGVPVAVTGPTVDESGYYLWVWRIAPADQSPDTQPYLDPATTPWTDTERAAETTMLPMTVTIGSRMANTDLPEGGTTTDAVAVTPNDGLWFVDQDATPIPVELSGTVFYSATEPTLQATPPPGAQVWSILSGTVSDAEPFSSSPITMPTAPGWLTIVWCATGGPELVAGCDQYGVPTETVRVLAPEVHTKAVPAAELGQSVHDTATISGAVPTLATTLTFALYRVPSGAADRTPSATANPAPTSDATDAGNADARSGAGSPWPCVEANLIYTAPEVAVTDLGDVDSPDFAPEVLGDYVWQATLTIVDKQTGDPVVVAQEDCGAEAERSSIVPPLPPTLASTGSPGWFIPVGLAALVAMATGFMLFFGRRLAQYREAHGYVREEDLMTFEQFQRLFDGDEDSSPAGDASSRE